MMDRHIATFREEAADLLRELEISILELEERPGDQELVSRVFRALHTLKGSGAMFGFTALAAFTHQVESAFDRVREGQLTVTHDLIGITLAARDHIQALLASGGKKPQPGGGEILGRLGRLVTPNFPEPERAPDATPAAAEGMASWRIRFEPTPDLFLTGANALLLLRELRELGECKITAQVDRIPDLGEYDCDQCYLSWDAVLQTPAGENAIRDVFIFVEDRANIEVRRVESEAVRMEAPRQQNSKVEAESTLRVTAAKLDNLVNIVGELVTMQARLSGYALESGDAEISFIAGEVERLTETLRESAMSMRMLPIGDTFARFKRLVRDLSTDLGKQVDLVVEGASTELDKSVIELLVDPLVHLVRNAIDHGIEPPDVRLSGGKPAAGRLLLSASHEGAFVTIRVMDDGGGLHYEAIRERAIERGLIAKDAALNDQQIAALILRPGFSTASTVSEVSGRGVGTDVVQRSIEALRGNLSIRSERGKGTTIELRIPLTLAIIDGLLVEAGGNCFVVPLSNISSCLELSRASASSRLESLVTVRDELVPYVVLRERFGIDGDPPEREQVIIAETREGRCGVVVDRVIGDHHTVVKKLGSLYRHVEEVSGATILGDGKVALILNVDKLAGAA